MQKITPFPWFDSQAAEAVSFLAERQIRSLMADRSHGVRQVVE